MTQILHITILAFFFVASSHWICVAAETGLDDLTREVITQIKAKEADLKSFSVRFVQIQKSRLFKELVRSEGIIQYAAGGKLLLKTETPASMVIVFDGQWIYIQNKEAGQIRKRRIGQRESILKKYFGVGLPVDELTRKFSIHVRSNAPLSGFTLDMTPRKSALAKHVKHISALVDETTWLPREVFIQQDHGDWSRIHLEFISVNQPLPPGVFELN